MLVRSRLVAVAVLVLLAGCGGGGSGGGGAPAGGPAGDDARAKADAAAAAYDRELRAYAERVARAADRRGGLRRLPGAPPRLAAAEAAGPAYAAAEATAARVGPVVDELRWLLRTDGKAEVALAYRAYLVGDGLRARAQRHQNVVYDRQTDRYDRVYLGSGARPSPAELRAYTAANNRDTAVYDRRVVGELERASRRLKRLGEGRRNPLWRSAIAYQREELAQAAGRVRRVIGDLRRHERLERGAVEQRLASLLPTYVRGLGAVAEHGDELVAGQVRTLLELAREGADGPGAPSVGDAYRRVASRGLPRPSRGQNPDDALNYRSWMLFRIRELERTRADRYRDAAAMLTLYTEDDGRSPYQPFLRSFTELANRGVAYGRDGTRELDAHLRWARERLAQPVPPAMEPLQRRVLPILQTWPVIDSLAAHTVQRRHFKRLRRAYNAFAAVVDDRRELHAATRAAIAATAPGAPDA